MIRSLDSGEVGLPLAHSRKRLAKETADEKAEAEKQLPTIKEAGLNKGRKLMY